MLIFATVVVAARRLLRGTGARIGAYGLVAVATLLKFYRAVLFGLALRERLRLAVAIVTVAAAGFAVFFAAYHVELKLTLANIPRGNWFQDMFGARNLSSGMAALGVGPASRRLGDFSVMTLAVLSSVTAFAVERGNFELSLFVIVALAGRLALSRGTVTRTIAYGLLLLAAFAKYFPAVLMAVTLRERPRFFVAINATATVVIAAFVIGYRADLLVAYANLPRFDYFGDMFGAVMLPYGLARLIPVFPAAIALAMLIAAVGTAAVTFAREPAVTQTYSELPEAERVFLAIGCLLTVGCFFAGQSIAYRGIHLLFVLPALNTLARTMSDAAGRRVFAAARAITLFLMWREAVHQIVIEHLLSVLPTWWLAAELAWWWLIAVLAGLTLCFVRHSTMGQIAARLPLPRLLVRASLGLPGERNPS